jgi:hypothetical protein
VYRLAQVSEPYPPARSDRSREAEVFPGCSLGLSPRRGEWADPRSGTAYRQWTWRVFRIRPSRGRQGAARSSPGRCCPCPWPSSRRGTRRRSSRSSPRSGFVASSENVLERLTLPLGSPAPGGGLRWACPWQSARRSPSGWPGGMTDTKSGKTRMLDELSELTGGPAVTPGGPWWRRDGGPRNRSGFRPRAPGSTAPTFCSPSRGSGPCWVARPASAFIRSWPRSWKSWSGLSLGGGSDRWLNPSIEPG